MRTAQEFQLDGELLLASARRCKLLLQVRPGCSQPSSLVSLRADGVLLVLDGALLFVAVRIAPLLDLMRSSPAILGRSDAVVPHTSFGSVLSTYAAQRMPS